MPSSFLGICATSARPKKAVRKRRSESGLDFSNAAMTYGKSHDIRKT